MFCDNFCRLNAVIASIQVPSVHCVTPTFWSSFLFTFKNTDLSSVTFFLLHLPFVRSPQWLNTRSVEASEAGKASISSANGTAIGKHWQFFRQRLIPPASLFNYNDCCIQVHAEIFSFIYEIVRILVIVIVTESDFFNFRLFDENYWTFVGIVIVTKIVLFSSTKIFVFAVDDEKNTVK